VVEQKLILPIVNGALRMLNKPKWLERLTKARHLTSNSQATPFEQEERWKFALVQIMRIIRDTHWTPKP